MVNIFYKQIALAEKLGVPTEEEAKTYLDNFARASALKDELVYVKVIKRITKALRQEMIALEVVTQAELLAHQIVDVSESRYQQIKEFYKCKSLDETKRKFDINQRAREEAAAQREPGYKPTEPDAPVE